MRRLVIPFLLRVTREWWRAPWFHVFLLTMLVILIRFWPMLVTGKTMYFADNYSLIVPGKMFTAEWLRQGVLPTWNPYLMAGLPWLADINQSVWYPSTLLFLALPTAQAVNATIILQVSLALVGMYLLSRRWTNHHPASLIVAALWAVSTQVSGSTNNLTTLQTIVWLPWLVWLGMAIGHDRRAPWWLAVVVWLQMAGGYPQHVVYGLVTASGVSAYRWWVGLGDRPAKEQLAQNSIIQIWGFWRPWLQAWLLAAGLSIGLSAMIWVPFVEVLLESTRMIQTNTQAAVGSLHPAMLVKLISPYFFDKPTAGMKWGPAWSGQPNVVFYVTLTGLISWLSVVVTKAKKMTKDDWFLGLVCGLTILLALGSYLPGYELLQQLIPFFRIARYPSMTLMITNLVALVWLATVLQRFSISNQWLKRSLVACGLGALVVGGLWLASSYYFGELWAVADALIRGRLSGSQFHTLARDMVIYQVILESAFVSLGLTAVSLWGLAKQRWLVVIVGMTLDMMYHTQGMYFFGPQSVYADQLPSPISRAIPPDPQSRWLTRNSNQPYTDFGSYWEAMVVRAPFSDSFVDRTELETAAHALRLRQGLTPDWHLLDRVPLIHGYTCLLPTTYANLWETNHTPGINFIDQIDPKNPLLGQWAVKYYLVDSWFKLTEPLPGRLRATTGQWQVYELPALARFRYETDQPVELLTFSETPNQLRLSFNNPAASAAAKLVIADRYDRHWEATVNNEVVPIEQWQEMRRVPIKSGENQVVLTHQVPALRWGMSLSAISFFAGVMVCFSNQSGKHSKWRHKVRG